ncbi:MarR family winged helix-turn-helix transcriptional regulator [Oceanicella sp. SM1341]|uniref:MarR family winged helix-turn-helix transcriptional regulator n=1 Tax=Oceanicella sp. SM1341 TaxID=1548889 RepID=UPI0018E54610|nr:MarR family transcriptional regulator [Oceanicella sp. SM1341]
MSRSGLRLVGEGAPAPAPAPRGLFDLEDFLPYRLNRISEEISLRFAREYKARYGMNRPEWRAIAIIGTRGAVTAREICDDSTMHKTKVSRAVAAMEKRRWLRREGHESDGRSEVLTLTREGWRVFEELMAMARAYEAELEEMVGAGAFGRLLSGLESLERRYGTCGPIRRPEDEAD